MKKLVVGCGYLGLRVARRWLAEGHTVAAVTRDPQRAEELRGKGLRAIVADVCRFRSPSGTLEVPFDSRFRSPSGTSEVPAGGRDLLTVLYAVGYDRRSGQSRCEVYVDGLKNVLDGLERPPERFIFISSTGVYGEDAGGWVDEDSPCNPTRESARALLAAEQVLQAHPIGRRAIILRLAGMYGPGRLRHAKLRDEETGTGSFSERSGEREILAASEKEPVPVSSGASPYINLIHVDDAASVVLAAEARAVPPRTYLVSDGHPVDRREFLACLARVSRVGENGTVPLSAEGDSPVFADTKTGTVPQDRGRLEKPSHEAGGRGLSSGLGKRVNNARMMRELGVELRYPTYREGLGEG